MNAVVRPGGGGAPARGGPSGGAYPTHYVRDLSGGVNLASGRESIQDNECWWLEGVMPQSPGNLAVLPGTKAWTTGIPGETGLPSYALSFSVGATPYVLVIWANTGNVYAWQYGVGMTLIGTGFTSGQTAACAWNNQGVLIVDPVAGYFDWNVSAGNTLTALSNSVQSITVTDGGAGYTSTPASSISGPGAGASTTTLMGIATVGLNNGGLGYAQGDVLTINYTFAVQGEAMTVTVAAVDNTGKITAFNLTTRGKGTGIPGTPVTPVGGTGSGAKLDVTFQVTAVRVDSRGHGYTSATVVFTGGAFSRTAVAKANLSGALTGTAIAAYAGRAWIASGRTITFTDAGSYFTFIGSGSQFSITDQYLVRSITALYAASNYLYIFGDTSVDVLSNVTISDAGTANFSRVNIDSSVGCNQPMSIFAFRRSVMFANGAGFWRLSGATPECVSEGRLDLLIQQLNFSFPISGCPVTLNGVLCAAFLFAFTDTFTTVGGTNHMAAIYYEGRWFFVRFTVDGTNLLPLGLMVGIPAPTADRSFQLWGFGSGSSNLYEGFEASSAAGRYWRVLTKLYDLGHPLQSKEVLRAGMGVNLSTTSLGNLQLSVDTESGAPLAPVSPLNGTGFPYRMLIGQQNVADNAKYVGFTSTGSGATTDVGRIDWFAFEHVETNAWQ